MPPLAYPDRPVPKGFDRGEVERLLATTESSTPVDLRDRAVLTVLATCGLRAGEVGALRVDDVDWERDMLRVFRPSKTGRTDTFPLTPAVGNALMDYLLKVRPGAGRERALFLTLQAPFRPLTSSAIGMIVRSRANRLGITGKRLGAHALRHAAAQRLVDEGVRPQDRRRPPRPFQPERDGRVRKDRSRLASPGRRHQPEGAAR